MATPPAAAAAELLGWLDATGEEAVMAHVAAALAAGGECGAGGGAAAPAVLLPLGVDATALMADAPALAMALLADAGGELSAAAERLINEQLASTTNERAPPAAADGQLDADGHGPEDDDRPQRPSIRLLLKLTQARAVQQLVSAGRGRAAALVSVLGVVTGVAPPGERAHSARYACPACSGAAQLLGGQHSLPCCGIAVVAPGVVEDLSGRVMVPAQALWVGELSSATGAPRGYGTSCPPLLVQLPEDAVGTCQLGAAVHVLGTAAAVLASGNGCSIQARRACAGGAARAAARLAAARQWPSRRPRSLAGDPAPLDTLWRLLGVALGRVQPLDPHLALALLLSAASVGGGGSGGGGGGAGWQSERGAAEQVSLLVLHDAHTPCTARLLREAAALLSPQSVAMPVRHAEHVTPILGGGNVADAGGAPVFASTLHLANAGVAVADLPTMPTKARQQLLTAAAQRATPLPRGLAPGALPLPLTATVWACTGWDEVCPGGAAGGAKGGGRAAAVALQAFQAFDLCLGDGTAHEDELFWEMELQRPHEQQRDAAAALRHLLAVAVAAPRPVLGEAAQAFLGQYFLVVRQSLASTSKVSKPALLSSLVRVAGGLARLAGRSEVLECPDAALAVLLMEQSLANKLGDAYQPLLDLPADLNPAQGRNLDAQLDLLAGIMARTFRQCCGDDEQHALDGGGGGWADGDDGDSGCGGGLGGCDDGSGCDE
ncbi:hypothetical protein HT031_006553 [Scenedesmus sp. PABB004]|nr:hypothetical protein HT031_006553 [Scenedesmus sp. PABB004]